MQGRIVYARMRQLIHVDVFGQANPAPYKAFWQNEDIRTAFLKDIYCIGSCSIYSSAVAVYIHQRLQYIFNCRCSIYSFFGCTILYGLFCLLRVRGDEVLTAVDDADKLGVFPLVELVYLIVVLLTYTSFLILHYRMSLMLTLFVMLCHECLATVRFSG